MEAFSFFLKACMPDYLQAVPVPHYSWLTADALLVQPNCWVQPVLSKHGDWEMPSIAFFAMRNIPPMEELAYDYGSSYIQTRLNGQCHCGHAVCAFAGPPLS